MSKQYDKHYLKGGSCKQIDFPNGGYVINLSIEEKELANLPRSTSNSGRSFVNISIGTRREPDQYGNTHSMYYTTERGGSDTSSSKAKESKGDDWDWE